MRARLLYCWARAAVVMRAIIHHSRSRSRLPVATGSGGAAPGRRAPWRARGRSLMPKKPRRACTQPAAPPPNKRKAEGDAAADAAVKNKDNATAALAVTLLHALLIGGTNTGATAVLPCCIFRSLGAARLWFRRAWGEARAGVGRSCQQETLPSCRRRRGRRRRAAGSRGQCGCSAGSA